MAPKGGEWQTATSKRGGSLSARLKLAGFADLSARCQRQELSAEELNLARAALAGLPAKTAGAAPWSKAASESSPSSSSRSRRRGQHEGGKGGRGTPRSPSSKGGKQQGVENSQPRECRWTCCTCGTKHFRDGEQSCRRCGDPRPAPPAPATPPAAAAPTAAGVANATTPRDKMDVAVEEIRGIMQDAGIVVGDSLPPEIQQALTTLKGFCTSKKPAVAPTTGSDRHLELTRTAHAAEQRLQDEQSKLAALQARRDRLEEEVQASTKAIECLRMKFEKAQADLVKDLQGHAGTRSG